MTIKCPRCDSKNDKKNQVCKSCGLPLRPNELAYCMANIKMQWDRLKEDKSDLLYVDSKVRMFPSSYIEGEKCEKRIVYHKKYRFVLLNFINIIWKKRAVIHFKLRPEKGMILFYKRNHQLSDLFMKALESIAEELEWNLKDITEIFDHHTKLEETVKKYPKEPQ